MSIGLFINEPRVELLREGWGLTRAAAAFRGAVYDPTEERIVPGEMAFEVEGDDAIDSENLWQEPETGVLFLRPHVFRSDLATNADWEPFWIRKADLQHTDADLLEVRNTQHDSIPIFLRTRRETMAAQFGGLPGVPSHLAPLTNAGGTLDRKGLKWIGRTNFQLSPNEAFSIFIAISGIPGIDRAGSLGAFAFGKRWLIDVGLDGQMSVLQNVGTGSSPNWVRRKRFTWFQGGAMNGTVLQITVLPWGIDGISILCSAAPQSGKAEAASTDRTEGAILFQTKKYGFNPNWDPALVHYVKTEADALTFALPKTGYHLDIAIARVRYKACGLRLAPEPIGEPKPGKTPVVNPIGYYPGGSTAQKGILDPTPGAEFVNEKYQPWDSNRDYWIAASTWLKPSTDGKYSPEIWAMEYEVDATTHTPTTTPVDLSPKWRRLGFRLSCEPDTSYLQLLYDRSDEWEQMFKLDGSVRLEIDGVDIFEGKFVHGRPYTEGGVGELTSDDIPRSTIAITDDAEAADLWEDLNETGIGHEISATKRSFGELFARAFKRAGVPDAQVSIDAELYSLEVDGWDRPNDWKLPTEDSTAGDSIRGIIARYGFQGSTGPRDIRVVRRDGIWYAYLTTEWDPEAPIERVFFLDSKCVPVVGATDADRWAGIGGTQYFKALSKPEFTVRRPRWNGINAYASTGSGDGSDALVCFIAPDPRIFDGADVDYQARARILEFGPPHTAGATTQNELERMARRENDRRCRVERMALLEAEWQPGVWPDQVFPVLGIAPKDGEDFLAGDVISYGAWRILSIDIEITMASGLEYVPVEDALPLWGSRPENRDWGRRGIYALEWAGVTQIEGIPMFAPPELLPREGGLLDP